MSVNISSSSCSSTQVHQQPVFRRPRMKPTPAGWSRFSSSVVYQDAAAAIEWLCSAFGFEVKLKVEGEHGRIEHCELSFGDGLIMLAQENPKAELAWKRSLRSPKSSGGANT